MTIVDLVTVTAALIIIGRILTFRRQGRHHRRAVAFIAWLAVAGSTWLAVRIIAAGEPNAWWLALLLATFAVLLLRCRGNIAHLITPRQKRRY